MTIARWIGIGIIQIAIGAIVLYLLNTVGSYVNVNVPINPITAAITGLLGVPGLLALLVIKLWIIKV